MCAQIQLCAFPLGGIHSAGESCCCGILVLEILTMLELFCPFKRVFQAALHLLFRTQSVLLCGSLALMLLSRATLLGL